MFFMKFLHIYDMLMCFQQMGSANRLRWNFQSIFLEYIVQENSSLITQDLIQLNFPLHILSSLRPAPC
jgi:hypothetical protein